MELVQGKCTRCNNMVLGNGKFCSPLCEMEQRREEQGQCTRCGNKKAEGRKYCVVCEKKQNKPAAQMYKNKGGLFKLDVLHIVSTKKQTTKTEG